MAATSQLLYPGSICFRHVLVTVMEDLCTANQAQEHSSNMQPVLIYSQHDAGIITNHDMTASASMAEFAYVHGKILSAAA